MLDNTARMIGTVGIWGASAVIITFGLCRMNFIEGRDFVLSLTIVCATAVVSTGLVWWGANRRGLQMPAGPAGFPVIPALPAERA